MLFPDFATLAHPRARGGIGGLRPRALRRRSWCLLAVCWGVAQLLAGPGVALPQEGSPGASRPATKSAPAFEFDPKPLAAIDHLMEEAIARHDCPGGVLWIEHAGVVHTRAYGRRAVVPKPEPMTPDTLFDAASLTKALATTPSILILFDRGKLDLEAPVARYLPRFQGEGRERVTLRHLLTHTSGLRSGLPRQPAWAGYDAGIERAVAERPEIPPGTEFRYSDINFILLGEVVRVVAGEPLNRFVEREIYRPLGMRETGFLPGPRLLRRTAPTERAGEEMLRGTVHDPSARLMGGVAGHAGLFTTAGDLARYCRMLLNEGTLDGVRILRAETVRQMASVQTAEGVAVRRGLGVDLDSPYSRPRGRHFPIGSFGHTGFTGTCFWIDPFSRTFWILLSSRLHPDGKGSVLSLQLEIGTLAAEAVTGFDFDHVPGALAPRGTNGAPSGPPRAGGAAVRR